MEIKGTLKKICPVEVIQGKNGEFSKRTIVVDCSSVDEVTGEIRENIIAFETSGRFCNDYDVYADHVGQKVTVRFGISGRCVTNGDGREKYYNTLRIIGIALDEPVVVRAPQTPAPALSPSPATAPAPKTDFNQPQPDGLPF